MAISPLVGRLLAQSQQYQTPPLSPLAPLGKIALAAALRAREKRDEKSAASEKSGLADVLAQITAQPGEMKNIALESLEGPQGTPGQSFQVEGVEGMTNRQNARDLYGKLPAGMLAEALMKQMAPEDQGKPQVVSPGSAVVKNGRVVYERPAAAPGPQSSRGKLFADFNSGAFGDPQSPEAKEQLRLALEADAGRGRTDISLTLPNGNSPTTSANQTAFQTKIMSGRDSLATLRTAAATFNPMFLTYKGKVDMGVMKVKDMAGMDLNKEQRELLTQYSQWQQASFETLNRTIKEMTGAAMSEVEAVRLRKQMPDPEKDGPTEYVAKFNGMNRSLQLAEARYQMALREGVPLSGADDLEGFMALDDVGKQINKAGEELYSSFKAQGMDEKTAKQKALQEVSARFGVAF